MTSGEFGELVIERNEDGTHIIVRADPRIRISWMLLRDSTAWQWYFGAQADGVFTMNGPGATIVITGRDRRVIYKLGAYDPATDTYEAEWPD